MTTAPPLASSSPPASLPPRPRINVRDYFARPSCSAPDTATTVPCPQSTDAMTASMGPRMPEPPGRMRRDGVEQTETRGNNSANGNHRGKGSVDEPIAIDLDGEIKATDHGEKIMVNGKEKVFGIGNSGSKDHGCAREGVLAEEVVGGNSVDARLEVNGAVQEIVAQAADAEGDTRIDSRMQRGRTTKAARSQNDEGSSMEKPVVIDEGYHSFSFAADASSNHSLPDSGRFRSGKQYCEIDELFNEDVKDSNSVAFGGAKEVSVEGLNRRQKAEEEAWIEEVNTLFRSHNSRAWDWGAEGQKFQVSNRDDHGPESQHTMDTGTRGLLKILTRESETSRQGEPVARGHEFSKATPVLRQRQAEVEARKRTAVERSRSARASNGNDTFRPTTSHKRAEVIRPDPEDDTAELMLAQERLRADLASRSQKKREREQNRLRKEKEANERASLVGGPSNAQKAMAANQEKTRKNARPARDEVAAEEKMIAEHKEEEHRRKTKVDEAKRIKVIADKLTSMRRSLAAEASRRIQRDRIDEDRRANAAERAGRPSVRIKDEDSGSDDAVRSRLARDRAARQAAAERSRSRQAQNVAKEKPKLVEARSLKTSESGQTSVALRQSSSGDEALVGNSMPSADSTVLESELHRAKEILQAAQKRMLEVETEARRVQAGCTAPKRRAEEADTENVIDQSIHKRARSIEQSIGINQSIFSSRNPSRVDDTSSPHRIETQSRVETPAKMSEERLKRKREANKRWRLKKQGERALLQARSQQEGIKGSRGSYQSKSSPTESEDNAGTDSEQKQPMGLRALHTPTLISNAQGLQEENNRAKSAVRLQPFITEDQDEHSTSNDNMKTVNPRRDNKAKSNMIRDRAAKDEQIDNLKATLATFQQPLADQNGTQEQTGTTDTYAVDSPIQQERQETVSSDEDEDETQEVRTSQPFRLSVPHQPLDMPEEAQPPQPRPTCARKTLPTQIHDTISEGDDSGKDVSSDPDSQPNEMIWGYQVTRKEWLHDEDPNDVGQTIDGPYWSKGQANSIAATDVHQERGSVKILAPMEFNMTIDALGMKTHSICSKGGNIATAVERVLIPPSRANGPMADKAWLLQKLFVALEKVSLSVADNNEASPGEHVPRTSTIRVLGVFTVLDLANRKASRCVLDHQTSRLGESQLDQILKAEKEMRARESLQVLERDSRAFESSCALSDGSGVVEVWVEEHPVMGPRN